MTKVKSGLNGLVKRLLGSRTFAENFRKHPETYGKKYNLTTSELKAVLEEDESSLVALGLDPKLVELKNPDRSWVFPLILQIGKRSLGAIAALVLLASTPAVALAGRGRARRRTLIVIRRREKGGCVVHPVRRRAARRRAATAKKIEEAWYYETRRRVADFAGEKRVDGGSTFGNYKEPDEALAALMKVDPTIQPVDPTTL